MTETEWLASKSIRSLLASVRLSGSQRFRFECECLDLTRRNVPCPAVSQMVDAGEALCSGRANIGVVDIARGRAAEEVDTYFKDRNSLRTAWRAVIHQFFRGPTNTFAYTCLEVIQQDAVDWIISLPTNRLSSQVLQDGTDFRTEALRAWDAVWKNSERLDSWAGSFNHVRNEALETASEAMFPLFARTCVPLLRCIVGNPFRPVTFSPSWLTETVTALAHSIYTDRAFDRLPILADALQEAGCEDEQVLTHCRGDGPHARGCWVVDGVLGKA